MVCFKKYIFIFIHHIPAIGEFILTHDPISNIKFFFSSGRRHTRLVSDWSSDVCSSDLRAHVFSQAEDGIRDWSVTGVQTCALLFSSRRRHTRLVSDWSSDVCSSDPSRRRHTRLVSDWSSDVCSSD